MNSKVQFVLLKDTSIWTSNNEVITIEDINYDWGDKRTIDADDFV